MLRWIRNGSGTGPFCVSHAQLLKVWFPVEPAKTKCAHTHSEGGQRWY
jgi:hypothetical protein